MRFVVILFLKIVAECAKMVAHVPHGTRWKGIALAVALIAVITIVEQVLLGLCKRK